MAQSAKDLCAYASDFEKSENVVVLSSVNDEARKYIFDITCGLIEKYHLSYMKFDFNNSFAYDPSFAGFYRYLEGQKKYVADLKARYPHLYLTNCASGGFRMDLEQAKLFDSFWISDNQGPYEGLTIYKDTALRLPPSCIEKWNVQTFCEGFPEYQKTELRRLPIPRPTPHIQRGRELWG